MYKWFHLYDTKFLTRLPFTSAGVYIVQLTWNYSQFKKNQSLRVDRTFLKIHESEKPLKWLNTMQYQTAARHCTMNPTQSSLASARKLEYGGQM